MRNRSKLFWPRKSYVTKLVGHRSTSISATSKTDLLDEEFDNSKYLPPDIRSVEPEVGNFSIPISNMAATTLKKPKSLPLRAISTKRKLKSWLLRDSSATHKQHIRNIRHIPKRKILKNQLTKRLKISNLICEKKTRLLKRKVKECWVRFCKYTRKNWIYTPPVFEHDINKRSPSEITHYFEFLCVMG